MRKKKAPYTSIEFGEAGGICIFPCYIMGDAWTYSLVTTEQMQIIAEDEDTAAYCSELERRIYVGEKYLNHTYVIHELIHAFKYQTSVGSADLTAHQVEEQLCDMFARQWPKILRLADIIYNNLKKFRDLEGSPNKVVWEDAGHTLVDRKFMDNMGNLIKNYDGGLGENPFKAVQKVLLRPNEQIEAAVKASKKPKS